MFKKTLIVIGVCFAIAVVAGYNAEAASSLKKCTSSDSCPAGTGEVCVAPLDIFLHERPVAYGVCRSTDDYILPQIAYKLAELWQEYRQELQKATDDYMKKHLAYSKIIGAFEKSDLGKQLQK